jgi:hypothetical protein
MLPIPSFRNCRRRMFIATALVVLLLIVSIATTRNRSVTLANAYKIHDGMSLSEIKSIMGGEPGEYTSWWYSKESREELHYEPINNTILWARQPSQKRLEWRSEEVVLHVWVDEHENEKVNLFDIWPRNPRLNCLSDFWSILTGRW